MQPELLCKDEGSVGRVAGEGWRGRALWCGGGVDLFLEFDIDGMKKT